MRNAVWWVLVLLALSLAIVSCDDDTIIPPKNKPPVALITSPSDGQSFTEGVSVDFAGSGKDKEDGTLSGNSLVWVSDKDSLLGTGALLSRDDLSVNTHVVTMTATDSDGDSDTDTVTIDIVEAPPVKVLFLGSSYFIYNDLPSLFGNLSLLGGKDVIVDQFYIYGGYLDDHAASAETEAKINSREWDYVVLQGVCTNTAFPDNHQNIFPPYVRHAFKPAITTLKQKIEANCSTTKTVYCMPWAFEDGMTWLGDYDIDYFEMQQMVYDNTIQFSDEVGFVIAPVGWAWNEVMTGLNMLHYLFKADWNHPSLRGSYLMACVIYSTLFQEDTNSILYYAGINQLEAKHFQSVASTIVLDDLELWNIQ